MANDFYYTEIRIESNSDAVAQSVARFIVGKAFTKDLKIDDGPYAEWQAEGVMKVRYCGYGRILAYEIDCLKSLSRPAGGDECRILFFESTTADWFESIFREFKGGKHKSLLHADLALDGIDDALLVVKARAGNSKAAAGLAEILDSCGSHLFDTSHDECACFFGTVEVLMQLDYLPPKSRVKGWARTVENLRSSVPQEWQWETAQMISWMETAMLRTKGGKAAVSRSSI